MSEILLAGVLAEYGKKYFSSANITEVELKKLNVEYDCLYFPIYSAGSNGRILRFSRLQQHEVEILNKIASIFSLAKIDLEIYLKGELKVVSALHSNEAPHLSDPFALQIVEAALISPNPDSLINGSKYFSASRVLALGEVHSNEIRHKGTQDDFLNIKLNPSRLNFQRTFEISTQFRKFSGTLSRTITRDMTSAPDAALVLPYDPKSDEIILIEQMRTAPLTRGSFDAWLLEPIAGCIDPFETPENTAIREAKEEAGIDIEELISLPPSYPSPGGLSQVFYTFIGIGDFSNYQKGIFGLDAENEDILTHKISFTYALELLNAGEINVTPLQMLLFALAFKREDIQNSFQ